MAVFFGLIAYFAGLQRGETSAPERRTAPFQSETSEAALLSADAPITAGKPLYAAACVDGANLAARIDPYGDAFCHPFFKAPPVASIAGAPALTGVTPRAKPARPLSIATTSAIAGNAFDNDAKNETPLSLALAPGGEIGGETGVAWPAPATPGGALPDALAFGPIFRGGQNAGGPSGGDDANGRPPVSPGPVDPPLPLAPGGPDDPIGPFDPNNPPDPVDPIAPTVVPIPGALILWGPGLAALLLAARRRKRRLSRRA